MSEGTLTRERAEGEHPAPAPRRRRRVSVTGVLGELLITGGVIVLLFIGWQQWLNDILIGQQLREDSLAQAYQWNIGQAQTEPAVQPSTEDPVVGKAPSANAERFGMLIVPRFGSDYYRPIAQGTGYFDVLNFNNLGHYPTTQMPGQVGNFAIAAHRKAYGGNLEKIHTLRPGDHIFVETKDGWYRYTFRNLEYVQPSAVEILDAVPQTTLEANDRYITLQSCNPFFVTQERIIAFGVFDGWFPRSGGAPAEIADTVKA